MAVSSVNVSSSRISEWAIGLLFGGLAIALLLVWLFWGRAIQLAILLAAAGSLVAMLRYPEISSFLTGLILVANLGAFIPGSTSGFFALALFVLIVRKLVSSVVHWRFGAIVLAASLFIAYYQASVLWADETYFYNWNPILRVPIAVLVVSDLVASRRHYLALFFGCAVGMTFTSISAMRTAVEFYTSGVADEIAGQVNSIETSRFFGHWPDPNIMSMTLTTFLGGVFGLWRSRINVYLRTLMFVAVVTSVAAVVISLSRAGLLTCIIVLLMMTAVERKRFTILAVFGCILAVLLTIVPADLFGRAASLFSGNDASGNERFALSLSGWRFFWSNPIFGGGIGSYENSVLYVIQHLPHGVFAHNTLVDIAVDGGLVGVALMAGAFFFAFKGLSWSDWRPDPYDPIAMLNAGLRSGLIATIFSMLTMSSAAYVPFWVYLVLCAMFALSCRQEKSAVTQAVA